MTTTTTTIDSNTPKIKLTYFDIEGVAEAIRLAFILAGIEFEDDRIQFSQWKELKATTPNGQLPVMTIDNGPMISQSGAMLRYVGSMDTAGSLYPPTKLLQIEQAIGILNDLSSAWKPSLYTSMRPTQYGYEENFPTTDKGKQVIQQLRTDFITNDLPKYLQYLNALLQQNTGTDDGDTGPTWLCGGDTPTIADCMAIPIIRQFTRGHIDHVDVDCVVNCQPAGPDIVNYVERFCSLPDIKGRYSTGLGSSSK